MRPQPLTFSLSRLLLTCFSVTTLIILLNCILLYFFGFFSVDTLLTLMLFESVSSFMVGSSLMTRSRLVLKGERRGLQAVPYPPRSLERLRRSLVEKHTSLSVKFFTVGLLLLFFTACIHLYYY